MHMVEVSASHRSLQTPTPDLCLCSLSPSSHPRPLQRLLPCCDPTCPALLVGTSQDLDGRGHRAREMLSDCTAVDSVAQGSPQIEVLLKGRALSPSQMTGVHPRSMSHTLVPQKSLTRGRKLTVGYHAPVHLQTSN